MGWELLELGNFLSKCHNTYLHKRHLKLKDPKEAFCKTYVQEYPTLQKISPI